MGFGYPTVGWCPGHGGVDHECCPLWREHRAQTPLSELHIHQARADTEETLRGCPVCCPETAFRKVVPRVGLGPGPGDAWAASRAQKDANREHAKHARTAHQDREATIRAGQGKLF